MTRRLAGFFSGVDSRVGDNWRAGLAGGYTSSNASVSARSSSAQIDTAHLAGYAGASYGAWNLRSGAAIGWSTVDSSRAIAFSGFSERENANYDASTAQLFGEVGYGMKWGNVAAEPFAGLAWVHLHTDAFRETGGFAALAAWNHNDDVGYSNVGLRLATNYMLPNDMTATPRIAVSWQRAFGDVVPVSVLAFQGGSAFGITGVPLARNAALVETGFDLHLTTRFAIGLGYVGRLAETGHDHAAKASLTIRF